MRYNRVLVKFSGGAMAGDRGWDFSPSALNHIADEVLKLHNLGVQVSVVVGGGNIFRGELGEEWGIERAEPFIRLRAIRHLEHGYIVILAAGTGNPYVTTDYPAVQRALELRSDATLAAKNGIGCRNPDRQRRGCIGRYAAG